MKLTDARIRELVRIGISKSSKLKNEALQGSELGVKDFIYQTEEDPIDLDSDSNEVAGLVFPIRRQDRPGSIGRYGMRDPIPSLAEKYCEGGSDPNPDLCTRYSNPNMHSGIDVGVPVGTDVLAPTSGVIRSTGSHTMVLDGNDGREYSFSHLDSFVSQAGSQVTSGQVIAKSGNKGPSTGPHLHFAVKESGRYIDPMTLWGNRSTLSIA